VKLPIRGRLFLASLAVVVVVVALAGAVAHVELHRWLEAHAASSGEIDAADARLRVLLALAGALGIAAAALLSALASQLFSRTLRTLVAHASALVGGQRFGDDEIGGLAGALQKLGTDLGRAMGALAAERDRFAAVIEAMSEGVIGIDADGRILFVNAAARALLGTESGIALVGRSVIEIARIPALDALAMRARTEAVVTEAEIELHSARAAPARLLLVRAGPLRGGGAVIVLHDVTEVRKLERVRRDFVANVSHELRTPVSVIRANAETLLLGGLDDRARAAGFVDAIDKHAERLSRLLGDLLDLSRVEAGQLTLVREPQVLLVIAKRAVESVEVQIKERRHDVRIDVDEHLVAIADGHALEQVLVNLIDNAVKYTPAGGHIMVRAMTDSADRVRVEVEDDGPGVLPHHRARLFERFYRVDSGRSRDVGGTGLGLAIVKHLVEAMGGSVGASAGPVRGSIFWIELFTKMSQS
jgi:two-component system phosphate regulon sensor histidine kinase PhoR